MYRAVEDGAVPVAKALDVRCQVEADGAVPNGVHRLSIEEVMGSRWNTTEIGVNGVKGQLAAPHTHTHAQQFSLEFSSLERFSALVFERTGQKVLGSMPNVRSLHVGLLEAQALPSAPNNSNA